MKQSPEDVRRTVLIVDDDATLRGALDSVLTPLGYRVLTTGEPETAYGLLDMERIDAVLVDIRMPTMSGPALYLAVIHRWPDLVGRVAFMSVEPDAPDVRPWLERNHCTVFQKPLGLHLVTRWLEGVVAEQASRRRAQS